MTAVTTETMTFYQNEDVTITYTAAASIAGYEFEWELNETRDKSSPYTIAVAHAAMTIDGLTITFTLDKEDTNITPGAYYAEIRGTDSSGEQAVGAVNKVTVLASITADA